MGEEIMQIVAIVLLAGSASATNPNRAQSDTPLLNELANMTATGGTSLPRDNPTRPDEPEPVTVDVSMSKKCMGYTMQISGCGIVTFGLVFGLYYQIRYM